MLPRAWLTLTVFFASATLLSAAMKIEPDRADGTYGKGERVTWTISGVEPPGQELSYVIQADGAREVAKGRLTAADGLAMMTAALDQPGTLLLTVTTPDQKKVRGGAAVAWTGIKPASVEPSDFDSFWAAKMEELRKTPPAPKLEEIDSGHPGVQLWKITLDGFRGTHVQGYLARPRGDAPAPAMLQVQYAGVYPLQKDWVVNPAKSGWLALNILAHDLPVDREGAFYAEQAKGPLKDYIQIGAGDREQHYFLRMYLSCVRAVDYLTARPDWNGKTLLVQGGSQGGMQGIAVAGLHPKVTAVTVSVPAGCDQAGGAAGRLVGFPWWVGSKEKVATVPYFDPVHFAARVKCPVLVGMGLVDTISPPTGVFAMCNRLAGPKRVLILPLASHEGAHAAYYGLQNQWWQAAAAAKPLPME